MPAEVANGGLVIVPEIFTEDTDGQGFDVTLKDGFQTIETASVLSMTATLRTNEATPQEIFAGANVMPGTGGRGAFPGADGLYRFTFTAADLKALGTDALQPRELTLFLVHSGDKKWRCAIRFTLRNLSAVVT